MNTWMTCGIRKKMEKEKDERMYKKKKQEKLIML